MTIRDWLSSGLVQTILVLFAPLAIAKTRQALRAYNRWRKSPKQPAKPRHTLRTVLLLIALACIALQEYLGRPANVFRRLHLPFDISPHSLQMAYARQIGLDQRGHRLLAKLSSREGRLTYVRLGEGSLLECAYCKSYTDHLLYTLPPRLGVYAAVVLVVGLLTYSSRKSLVLVLASAFVAEVSLLYSADWFATLQQAPLSGWLHELRYVLIAAIVVAAYLLPERGNEVLEQLQQVVGLQERGRMRLSAAHLQHSAIMSDDEMRGKLGRHWAKQADDAKRARADEEVQEIMDDLDLQEGGSRRAEMEQFVQVTGNMPPPPVMRQ